MASRFTRGEIRKILGDAHTDEIENQLIALHLAVVDPLKDDLTKYKEEADKLPDVQKELDGYKNGKDWKAEFDKEHQAFEDYKAEVAGKEQLAAKQAAFRRLLSDEHIPDKFHDRILKMTDFNDAELEGDRFKDEATWRQSITNEWSDFKAIKETQGDKPENPPKNTPKTFDTMSLAEKMRYANENPNAPEVRAWLGN